LEILLLQGLLSVKYFGFDKFGYIFYFKPDFQNLQDINWEMPNILSKFEILRIKPTVYYTPTLLSFATMQHEYSNDYIKSLENKLKQLERENEQLRHEISEMNTQFSDIQRIAETGWIYVDYTTNQIIISDKVADIFGYNSNEIPITLKFLMSCISKSDREKIKKTLTSFLDNPAITQNQLEFCFQKKNGEKCIGYSKFEIKRNRDGKPLTTKAIVYDITQQKNTERRAKEYSDFLERLLETVPIPIFYKDNMGRYLGCNSIFEQYTGFRRENIIGKSVYEIAPKHLADIYHATDMELFEKIGTQKYEAQMRYADGTMHDIVYHKSTFTDAEGNIAGLIGVMFDLTGIKKAEQTMTLTQFFIDNTTERIHWIDNNGKHIYVNNAACEGLGYTEMELLAMYVWELDPNIKEYYWETSWITMRKNRNWTIQTKHKHKNGVFFPVEINMNYLRYNDIEILFCTIKDITERLKAQQEIIEHKQFLDSIIDNLPVGIQIFDENGFSLRMNEAQRALLGLPDTNYGVGVFNVLTDPFTKAQGQDELYRRVYEGEFFVNQEISTKFDIEENVWDTKRKNLYFNQTVFPVLNTDATVRAAVALLSNITEKKHAEIALQESEAQLRELNATKDKFFSIIAHDLKNPFNQILGFTEILLTDFESLEVSYIKEIITLINSSSNKTFALLQNLLDWSRSQTGRMEFSPTQLNLATVVELAADLLTSYAEMKKIVMKIEIDADIEVYADEKMLATVIRNLVSNAIKFTHKEGKISITAQLLSGIPALCEISVIDNGVGISAENIDRLFRIDKNYSMAGTDNETGTGLGLILCKEFIERNGGKIRVESETGKGSRFIFTLPVIG